MSRHILPTPNQTVFVLYSYWAEKQ